MPTRIVVSHSFQVSIALLLAEGGISMKRYCFVIVFVASVMAAPLPAFSGTIRVKHFGSISDPTSRKGELCVLDGDLMCVSFLEQPPMPGAPEAEPLPDFSMYFLRDGLLLRARIVPQNTVADREGNFSKELLAKEDWYITADFSTDPPRVILTEQPTQYSRWTLESPHLPHANIKNIDAPGPAAWLSVQAEGKTYRGGIARRLILSAKRDDGFWITDRSPRKGKPLGIDMKVASDGFLGNYKARQPVNEKPSGPWPPKFHYFQFFWDGAHLQVRPGNQHKDEWSPEERAKDGWYVTADYSVNPPRVKLTKEPTKDSRWSFLPASSPGRYYIRNNNDLGKDAWLNMVDTGIRYSWGPVGVGVGYRDVRVYKAVLSFHVTREFFVNDIEEDGGK
jgi:hypothetical protein